MPEIREPREIRLCFLILQIVQGVVDLNKAYSANSILNSVVGMIQSGAIKISDIDCESGKSVENRIREIVHEIYDNNVIPDLVRAESGAEFIYSKKKSVFNSIKKTAFAANQSLILFRELVK